MKQLKILFAALFLIGAIAGPAAAKQDAGAFTGVAEVGSFFVTPCGNDGLGQPGGKGLYLPSLNDHNAVYRLSADVTSVLNGTGTFSVCGYLTKVAGIGAACGWSKGYDGQGKAFWPAKGNVEYDLNNIHWKFAPAGTIIVSGEVVETHGGTKVSTGKPVGALFAVIQAAVDDAQCADVKPNNGENNITVSGAYWVDQTGAAPSDQNELTSDDPKDDGKSCNTVGLGKQCSGGQLINIWGDKK